MRGLFLDALGFQVVNVRNAYGACHVLHSGAEIDVAILCHTLRLAEKLAFESYVRISRPNVQLVELYLAESPVTGGLAVEADTEFQSLMLKWAESHTARGQKRAPGEGTGTDAVPSLRDTAD